MKKTGEVASKAQRAMWKGEQFILWNFRGRSQIKYRKVWKKDCGSGKKSCLTALIYLNVIERISVNWEPPEVEEGLLGGCQGSPRVTWEGLAEGTNRKMIRQHRRHNGVKTLGSTPHLWISQVWISQGRECRRHNVTPKAGVRCWRQGRNKCMNPRCWAGRKLPVGGKQRGVTPGLWWGQGADERLLGLREAGRRAESSNPTLDPMAVRLSWGYLFLSLAPVLTW